jgi:hypothetical protein
MSEKKRSAGKRSPVLFLCLLSIFLAVTPMVRADTVLDEYRVKAMLIPKLMKYVSWPPEAGMDNMDTPFILTVIGNSPINKHLKVIFATKLIKRKSIKLLFLKDVNELTECHAIFISEMSKKNLNNVLAFARSRPILTIGDTLGYAKRGVHLNLRISAVMRGRNIRTNIRPEINENAIRHAGLILSKSIFTLRSFSISNVEPYQPYREKAQKLKNLISFVDWPNGSGMDDTTKPFVIMVLGENVFRPHLEDTFKRERAKNKMVQIRTADTIEQVGNTQILLVPDSKKAEVPKILELMKNKPILLVGDYEGFARQGGHLNFFYDFARLTFEINNDEARKAGFAIRSNLLKYSKLVSSVLQK